MADKLPAIALRRAPQEIPEPTAPLKVANVLCESCFTYDDGNIVLRHWRGGWWHWRDGWWQELKNREIIADLFQLLADCVYADEDGLVSPWEPTKSKLTNLTHAMASVCHLRDAVEQPSWLANGPKGRIVACENGLLNVNTRELYPHTPAFLNQTMVPFAYDPEAPPPERWLEFLEELWPGETDQQRALQEWFGYVISGRTDLQKIFLLVGPTRAGKGVISGILSELLGRTNVANPTLSSLGGEFGLAPLIGKPLGLVSDARLGTRDSSVPVERLLSISGEDALTINIKYREQWTGKLPTRLMVVSNELPAFTDASGAIVGRFLTLVLTKSWFGHEDHNLARSLRQDLPGILNWALYGLERLEQQDEFTRVRASDEIQKSMLDLVSPVKAFVRECCTVGPDLEANTTAVYHAWDQWANANGHGRKTAQGFGKDLRAAVPGLRIKQVRDGDERHRVYTGLALA